MIDEVTSIESDGINLLLCQFRNSGNVPEFVRAFLREVQTLESAAVQSIAARYLMNATGWSLEQIGELVGMPRPVYGPAANDDDQYRILILGQIAANISHGTIPELYSILQSLGLLNVVIWDVYPAAIITNYAQSSLITPAQIRQILERATHPIGIDAIAIITDETFGFEGDLSAYGFDGGGFADAS